MGLYVQDRSTTTPVGESTRGPHAVYVAPRDVGFGFPLFFALLIEIVSAFGPVTVVRFAEVSLAGPMYPDLVRLHPLMTGSAVSRHGRSARCNMPQTELEELFAFVKEQR
jgi:hypothetical protein